jgi:hypothetical protein
MTAQPLMGAKSGSLDGSPSCTPPTRNKEKHKELSADD